MTEAEKDRQELLREINHKILCNEYDEADRLCDYYRLLYGLLPGEVYKQQIKEDN